MTAVAETTANAFDNADEMNSGIVFSIEEITPERAKEMTDRAVDFRKDLNAIAIYSEAMANGKWILNGQPIIFDHAGNLLDGYQRLRACQQSGVSFRTMVARNVSADTLHTIDQHRRRSYQNVLESRGIAHPGQVRLLLSKMIKIENGQLGKNNMEISWSRFDRVLSANPEIHEAVAMAAKVGSGEGGLKKNARSPLAFMAIRAGKGQACEDFLKDMTNSGLPMENPARMLSSQLTFSRMRQFDHDIDETIAMAVMAFNDFTANKKATANYFWQPDLGNESKKKRDAVDWNVVRKTGAANLGMPIVDGYPGVREGRIQLAGVRIDGNTRSGFVDRVFSQMDADIAAAAKADAGREEVRMMLVTPEMAGEWLRYNDGNRKIQDTHVKAIARDITKGNWQVNAQPICFTTDPENPKEGVKPRLLNGQHRLYAIIEAKMPVEIPIAFNIPEQAFATFDTHAKRSVAKQGAKVDDRVVSSAAKFQWREDNGYQLFDEKDRVPTPSSSEIRETLELHPNLMAGFPRSRRKEMLKIATAGVMTYFIYRISREHAAMAEEFLDGLETGVGATLGSPILRARNQLRDSERASRKETLKLLLGYWDMFKEWKQKEERKASKSNARRDKDVEMDETTGEDAETSEGQAALL